MTQALMLIEATGIQRYIFGSNKLVQQVAASELVRQATVDWVRENLPGKHNFTEVDESGAAVLSDQMLERDGLDAEVVYAGGGNAMLIFAEEDQAKQFARTLTRTTLEAAPNLNLVLIRAPIELGHGNLRDIHQRLRAELAQRKLDRRLSTPVEGLAVTAACAYTGMPAVDVGRDGELISAEVQAKLDEAIMKQVDTRLYSAVPEVKKRGYMFAHDFEYFGTADESRYIAVIHADGNRMGERIKKLGATNPNDDRGYINALREFSASVEGAARDALASTVSLMLTAIKEDKIAGEVPIRKRQLPFRPIVYGGDDVTFVAEGRLGLALAAHYLNTYSHHTLSDKKAAHARAGVAIVKSHFPFALAYHLAEELCGQAKRHIKQVGNDEMTALDWHIAKSGLVNALDDIRKTDYVIQGEGSLLMRPLSLYPEVDWCTWQQFKKIATEFKQRKWPRSKCAALEAQLRLGRRATAEWLALQRNAALRELPPIPGLASMQTQGWHGDRCGYYDVLEALDDFFIPLEEVAV